MQDVTIIQGRYRNEPITDIRCKLMRPIKTGAKGWYGNFDVPGMGVIRVTLPNEQAVEYHSVISNETPEEIETDEAIIARIEDRFAILEEITHSVAQGDVRSLIVSGAPGVGKSAGITKILENEKHQHGLEYTKVTGSIVSAYQLYQTLFENKELNSVLILDDSDQILYDSNSVNLLKAALESGNNPRIISYHSDSVVNLGLPKSFEFEGQIIFITNCDFQKIIDKDRAGIAKHLSALLDRSLYLSLTLHTRREIWCRVKSMVEKHGLLNNFDLTDRQIQDLLEYVKERQSDFRSFSLRTVLQLAQFVKTSPTGWRRMSEAFQVRVEKKRQQ